MSDDTENLMSFAHGLADLAGPIALRHFRSGGLRTRAKPGAGRADENHFDPVTEADLGIERALRARIDAQRPDDGILGEEFGNKPSNSGLTWVIDPIDGTRSFMSGVPLWGTLIALNDGARPVLGILDQPFTGERFFHGPSLDRSQWQRGEEVRPLHTSDCASLDDAVLFCTSTEPMSGPEKAGFTLLSGQAKLTRFGADCYAFGLLAAGQVDLVVEAGLQPYDIQALIPIIEGAGGIVCSWTGDDAQHGGRVLAAANPVIRDAALEILASV